MLYSINVVQESQGKVSQIMRVGGKIGNERCDDVDMTDEGVGGGRVVGRVVAVKEAV